MFPVIPYNEEMRQAYCRKTWEAHHLDLRSSNTQDPESVRVARYKEINEIIKWIDQAKQQQQ